MQYISTRGKAPKLDFSQALLAGLASDGGLYVPEYFPEFTPDEIASFAIDDYPTLAYKIIKPFIGDSLNDEIIKSAIKEAYNKSNFSHQAIAPLWQIDHQNWVIDLFHGPTRAFKDFALQLFGLLLEHILEAKKEKVIIIGATSGDTGSAAIIGCKHCHNADIFILHPHEKTSLAQRKQMTTTGAKNVHNIAIKGNFDDCQSIVKKIFNSQKKINFGRKLISVNSINWARITAQIVYYFYAASRLGSPARKISFSVPTGNFGDIFAGYIAYKMGLPIEKLIVATNENDILTRFINNNSYKKEKLKHSLSPSMDIQISSNFERLLFDIYQDSSEINKLMEEFQATGSLKVTDKALAKIRNIFCSYSTNDKQICETIKNIKDTTGQIIDPHTATGVRAAKLYQENSTNPIVTLATAHPAKFPEAANKSRLELNEIPANLKFDGKKEEFDILENDSELVVNYIKNFC